MLGLDNAGWHTAPNLVVPEGLRLVYCPRTRPSFSPPSTSGHSDEPLANQPFETLADLERTVADPCRDLEGGQLSLGTSPIGGPASHPELISRRSYH